MMATAAPSTRLSQNVNSHTLLLSNRHSTQSVNCQVMCLLLTAARSTALRRGPPPRRNRAVLPLISLRRVTSPIPNASRNRGKCAAPFHLSPSSAFPPRPSFQPRLNHGKMIHNHFPSIQQTRSNHDPTILRVESMNDFNTTIPHPRSSNSDSTMRKRIRSAVAESSSSWHLGGYAVSIRSDFRGICSRRSHSRAERVDRVESVALLDAKRP